MPNMANPRLIAEIKKRHGSVIDLNRNPNLILEIIRDFHPILVRGNDDGGGGAPGTPPPPRGPDSPSPSPPGGGGAPGNPPSPPPPRGPDDREIGMATIMNLLLELKRDVGALKTTVELGTLNIKAATGVKGTSDVGALKTKAGKLK